MLQRTSCKRVLFSFRRQHLLLGSRIEYRASFSSAQPLPEDQYDEENAWEPRRKRSLNKNQFVISNQQQQFKRNNPITHSEDLRLSQIAVSVQSLDEVENQALQSNKSTSPKSLCYSGEKQIPITSTLHIVTPSEDTPRGTWPVFRLMDQDGRFRNPALDGMEGQRQIMKHNHSERNSSKDLSSLRKYLNEVECPFQANEIDTSGLLHSTPTVYGDIDSTNTLWRVYRQTVRLREMDTVLLNAQRQGRISFYLTCTGEEAIHMGAASALDVGDPILAQYREQGILMWRGFTLEQFTNQCFSNDKDLGKGRQMPIHYGSRALNYHTISSPLGTQLPQAVGVAYRLKLTKKPNVAVAFFGEGCSSTTDFHSALNFAAALKAPCIFFCRNNGYAISTPEKEQFAGDGVVSRAPGYGMAAIRVDGNDVFAVHAAVREAKRYALQNSAPVLIEAITYRVGHHSTSDDSSAYRDMKEVENVVTNADPLDRLEAFLKRHNWLTDDEKKSIKDDERKAILKAFQMAEKRPKPSLDDMFEDVYCEMPPHLHEQKAQLLQHIARYPDYYK